MKVKVARYYNELSSWHIAVYPVRLNTEAKPHDWEWLMAPEQWERTGCRVPKKGETLVADLTTTEVVA